ncbi:MAG: hypothetical protein NTW94_06485 [Legionellales bacterium]|nr:hypothetical protein [Legionellales bacterium]
MPKNNEVYDHLNKLCTKKVAEADREGIITALNALVEAPLTDDGYSIFRKAVLDNQELLTGSKTTFAGELNNEAFLANKPRPKYTIGDLQSIAARAMVCLSLYKLTQKDLDDIIIAPITTLRNKIGANVSLGTLNNIADYNLEGNNRQNLLYDDALKFIQEQAKKIKLEPIEAKANAQIQKIKTEGQLFDSIAKEIVATDFSTKPQNEKLAILTRAVESIGKVVVENKNFDTYISTPDAKSIIAQCAPLTTSTYPLQGEREAAVKTIQDALTSIKDNLTTLVTNTAPNPPASPATTPLSSAEETAALLLKKRKDDLTMVTQAILLLEKCDPAFPLEEMQPLKTHQNTIEENIRLLTLDHYAEKSQSVLKTIRDIEITIKKNIPSLTEAKKRADRKKAIAAFEEIEREKNEINEILNKEKTKTPTTELKAALDIHLTRFTHVNQEVNKAKDLLKRINDQFPAEIFLQKVRKQGLMADFGPDVLVDKSADIEGLTEDEKRLAEVRDRASSSVHGLQTLFAPSVIQGELLDRNQIVRSTAAFGRDKTGTIELQVIKDSSNKNNNGRALVIDRTLYDSKTNNLTTRQKALMAIKMAEMLLNHYNPTAGPIVIGGKDKEQVRRLHAALLLLRPYEKIKITNSNEDGPEKVGKLNFTRQSTINNEFIKAQFPSAECDTLIMDIKASDMQKRLKQTLETIEEEVGDEDPTYRAGSNYGMRP